MDELHNRFATQRVRAALRDTPVVIVNGPRQCGKTTLVQLLGGKERTYLTLDDETVFQAARADPVGFLRGLDRVTLDEVQRVPELLRAVKRSVDERRDPGRFLLTGSADLLTLPLVADSLAGRMEVVTLLPLSQSEIRGSRSDFLESLFSGKPSKGKASVVGEALVEVVLAGGYPEVLSRSSPERRAAWSRQYLQAIIQRDVRDIAEVYKLNEIPRLLRAMAHHSSQLINFAQLGGELGLDGKTAGRYATILEQLFLVRQIEPWSRNNLTRLVKTPKLQFLDSGLLATLTGSTVKRLQADRQAFGALLETFVFSELLKQLSWRDELCALSHFRDKDKNEVDLVLESEIGALIGIEVKATASVLPRHFDGLRKLQHATPRSFKVGVVLYDGDEVIPFGNQLFALPVSALWS